MPYYIFFDSLYNLETLVVPTNAIVYFVAASALLYKLTSLIKSLRITPEDAKTAFTAYKLVFTVILLECLSLIICLDGFKVQMGILTWIIYMSALMILFMVFLTLTLDEFVYRPSLAINLKDGITVASINNNGSTPYFTSITFLFFFIFFILISFDMLYLLDRSEQLNAAIISSDLNNLTILTQQNSSNSDIFYTIAKDISSSHAEYILSGLVQGVCLISVILLIVFR